MERSINVLMALRQRPRTLTEVANEANLSKATAFRMLASLNHELVVVKNPQTNRYALGPGLLGLWQGVIDNLGSVTGTARSALTALRDETDETVALHVAVGMERICVDEVQSTASIRYTSHPGAVAPLNLGSAGRVLLAFMDDAQREYAFRYLELGDPLRPKIDVESLRRLVQETRERRYAMSYGERIADAAAISVPVRAPGFLASLSVLGPGARLSEQRRLGLLPSLQGAAREVELTLERAYCITDSDGNSD